MNHLIINIIYKQEKRHLDYFNALSQNWHSDDDLLTENLEEKGRYKNSGYFAADPYAKTTLC